MDFEIELVDLEAEPADLEAEPTILEVEPANFVLGFGLGVGLLRKSIEEQWEKVGKKYEWLHMVQTELVQIEQMLVSLYRKDWWRKYLLYKLLYFSY